MFNQPALDRTRAECIAIRLLGAIAGNELRLRQFLATTGYRPETIRACAEDDPRFLATVADYVYDDPDLCSDLIDERVLRPGDLDMTRYALRELPEKPGHLRVVRS